jgi:predicted nucleic acid-binding protein
MKADAIKRCVLDASVTLAWCIPDEDATDADAILELLTGQATAVVPAIWPFEVANAMLAAERSNRLSSAQTIAALQRIADLPISVEPVSSGRLFDQVLSVARSQGLTEYDAAYLELALRENLPLATFDDRLRAAARKSGVALVQI